MEQRILPLFPSLKGEFGPLTVFRKKNHVNPLSANRGLAFLHLVGSLPIAFLPAGFDEQLVLELLKQSVERLLDAILYALERLLNVFELD